MLDKHPEIDVLDIATGDYTHHVIAKMAAERKVHVLVEKPMAPTLPRRHHRQLQEEWRSL
ncbi:Gfo/Idh/MocA family oxidoreductase [Chloroflexi bacterium TSY]|nr:Gfo/Idh/MocA family oxidoreductase [Chloroflexi bacterium TSY]